MSVRGAKYLVWFLFFAGLFSEFCAFLVDHAEKIPFTRAALLGGFRQDELGFEQLEQDREIKEGEPYFKHFTTFLTSALNSDKLQVRQAGYKDVGRLESGIARVAHRVSKDSEPLNLPQLIMLRAYLKDGGVVYVNRDKLRDLIQERIAWRFIWTSAAIFVFGIGLQLLSFLRNERLVHT